MRAMAGVAGSLWELGRGEEAVECYQELLHFSPNDNQGMRYLLLEVFQDLGRQDEVEKLLEGYGEDYSPDWSYTRALLTFRKDGASSQAAQELQKAFEMNGHVAAYLIGKKRISERQSESIIVGGEEEAMLYASSYLKYWRKTKGAIAWLESECAISQ
jgi:tetratricopeptide (TPR) repeat protein